MIFQAYLSNGKWRRPGGLERLWTDIGESEDGKIRVFTNHFYTEGMVRLSPTTFVYLGNKELSAPEHRDCRERTCGANLRRTA